MRLLLLAPVLVIFLACNNSDKNMKQNNDADKSFQQLADEFLNGYLAWRPQAAVALGFHEYDGKISNFDKASVDGELKRLREYDQKVAAIDTTALGEKVFYDYRILRAAIKNELFNFEDLRVYTHNPMTYAGLLDVNLYIKRNYAPLEQRLQSIISVEQQTPSIIQAAQSNLEDSLPKPYIETAMAIAGGTVDFLKGDLNVALKELKNESLMSQFKIANDTAIASLQKFVEWLKKEKLPRASDKYAIGKANYQKMLFYNEDISLSPEKILELGLAELKKEQERFNSAAKVIDPNKKPIDVYHAIQATEHPTAESLIPDAKKHLELIRQFLIDKNIVAMPSEVRVQVKETPQYARATSTASMDVPGPFEKATEAYYYITPVDPKWTEQQKKDWLAQFDYYTTDNVTVHEAYPGHYTQFLHLNASDATKIEKIFGSYAFIEGWAHYCEIMMNEQGYGNNGDSVQAAKYKLAQSGDALLRLCRLCVSVKMHCQGMTVDEGTKFFMDNWYQGEKPSRQEATRGSFDPGYLFYTVGKLEILKLRDDYKKQEGNNFNLKRFHDVVLGHGMPPIRLLREKLLEDKNSWEDILY